MSAKQAINDKLQGSIDTHLTCGGVVNNKIRKGLLLSIVFLIGKYLAKLQTRERDCLMRFHRLSAVCWPGAQSV